MPLRRNRIPIWLKVIWTAFMAVLVPVYWIHYGPSNFLWFSDIALFLSTAALWLENRLLASIAAISVLPLEVLWNIELLLRLIFWGGDGGGPLRMTVYMWDDSRTMGVRLLSLFHVPMPPLMIWLVWSLGYDRRALMLQTILAWVVLPVSYALARDDNNITWTLGFGSQQPNPLFKAPLLHMALLMVAFPLLVYVPMHFLLRGLFGREPGKPIPEGRPQSVRFPPNRRVLILCTGNIARSQMAEGLWRHYGGEAWEVCSAGTRPRAQVHPLAIRVMAEHGIDIRDQRPKPVAAFVTENFDVVVTVCAQADQECPVFANATQRERWPLDDPTIAGDDPEQQLAIFRRIRDEAAARIRAFLDAADLTSRSASIQP